MTTRPPLMILCHGSGTTWTARVLKVGTAGGKWRRPDEGDGREATAQTARDAVLKAITLQGKEPRVCRRCARTWECKRTRAITICPQCQTRKAPPVEIAPMVPLVVNEFHTRAEADAWIAEQALRERETD